MIKHLNIKVYGQVQGVFFRASAKMEAEALGLTGFTRNEQDGSVYIEIEGEEKTLDKFISWCKNGPDFAQVTNVRPEEGPIKNFSGFLIT